MGRDAAQASDAGEGGGVVARGVRRHTVCRFGIGESEDCIGCSARFKRADLLEILALEEQLRPAKRIERGAGEHRGAVNLIRDPRVRGANVGKGERGVHGRIGGSSESQTPAL